MELLHAIKHIFDEKIFIKNVKRGFLLTHITGGNIISTFLGKKKLLCRCISNMYRLAFDL
jgi:hypothetical protein